MKILQIKNIVVFVLFFSFLPGSAEVRAGTGGLDLNTQSASIPGSGQKKSRTKVKKAPSAARAIKAREAKEKKLKQEYEKSVIASKKRSYQIQTPDVQARMKQDKKNISSRDRIKKKRASTANKKAERKYNK